MMELLLAKFNASMKEHMQEMKAEMKTNQAKAKANQEDLLAKREAKMDANQAKANKRRCWPEGEKALNLGKRKLDP
jgi:hypothetical protein